MIIISSNRGRCIKQCPFCYQKGGIIIYTYYPSCNFTKASPESAKQIRNYLKQRMAVAGCCRSDLRELAPSDLAVYFCQACRETLKPRGIQTISLWEYLDLDDQFIWPNYHGMQMNLQDCWRDRKQPQIHQAVRNLLQKMNIQAVELEGENRAQALFCGNLHFQPQKEKNKRLFEQYPDKPIYEMPIAAETALMKEQVEKYSCEWAVAYCNRCVSGINLGGGRAIHLLDLVMGNFTKNSH